MSNYPHLFTPIDLNGMKLANRMVLTAMVTRLSGTDGYVNQDIIDRYVRFAMGEVGLIVVEASAVHGARSGQLLRMSEERFIAGHREMVNRVHNSSSTSQPFVASHCAKSSKSE